MNNVGNEYEMKTSNNYVSEQQIKAYSWPVVTDVPTILFAKVGAAVFLNRKRLSRFPFLMDNNTMAYSLSIYWDPDFARQLFENIYLPRYAQTGALPSYNAGDIEDIKVYLPIKIDEQRYISNFLCHLDTLITLHQRKRHEDI